MFIPPGRYFEVKPISKIGNGPSFKDDENKKREFGIELAKTTKAFEAASNLYPDDTGSAVWISLNWINDPIVIAAKDVYLKSVELDTPLLDKQQYAARLLAVAEEKDQESGRYLIDAKDRLKAYELYGKTQGFIDAPEDHSNKTFINNGITLKIVKPEIKEEKVIDLAPADAELQPSNVLNALPVKLKLVS